MIVQKNLKRIRKVISYVKKNTPTCFLNSVHAHALSVWYDTLYCSLLWHVIFPRCHTHTIKISTTNRCYKNLNIIGINKRRQEYILQQITSQNTGFDITGDCVITSSLFSSGPFCPGTLRPEASGRPDGGLLQRPAARGGHGQGPERHPADHSLADQRHGACHGHSRTPPEGDTLTLYLGSFMSSAADSWFCPLRLI